MSVHADERIGRLELDVDSRILDLWAKASTLNLAAEDFALLGAFMRAAYAAGYQQALEEPRRGLLHRTHGYAVPRQRP